MSLSHRINKLLILLTGSFLFCTAVNADTIHSRKYELNRINGEIQTLQKTLKQDQQQQIDLQQQLKTSEISISQLSQQVASFNAAFIQEQTQLAQLKNAQEISSKKLMTQRNALAQQVRAAYQMDQSQSLKIFLNHQDPNVLARHLTYYRYLSEARLNLITQIRHTLTSVTENVHAINQHQQNLKYLLQQKQQQQAQQLNAQESRQNLIATLDHSVQSKQQQINLLLTNQKALQQLLAQLQTVTTNTISGQPFNNLRQKLQWPVKGSISASFGSLLDVGEQRLNGVIIKAPEGTPVHPVYPGKVIFASWLRGFGLLVIINHNHNYMTLYARNHTLYAKVGDFVNTGDTIATTGSSGGYNKSSLYFEIRQNGSPVNPAQWCR